MGPINRKLWFENFLIVGSTPPPNRFNVYIFQTIQAEHPNLHRTNPFDNSYGSVKKVEIEWLKTTLLLSHEL